MPLVCFDYAWFLDKSDGVRFEVELDDESAARVLVVAFRTADDMCSCVFGHVVLCKGVDDHRFAVDCLAEDALLSGYIQEKEPANRLSSKCLLSRSEN